MSTTRFLLALTLCVIAVGATMAREARSETQPEMACVHGGIDGPTGSNPFYCWCVRWAPNHKICLDIEWGYGGRNNRPPPRFVPLSGPEPSPQARAAHHKARIVRHAYWYRTVWTASDGTPIYVSCRVARQTRCWIRRIG